MQKHNRQTIRKEGYDYSKPNQYFITVCSKYHQYFFGAIKDGIMHLNLFGNIVADEWKRTSAIRNEIRLNEFVIMPNHFHGLLTIDFQSEQAINNCLAEQKKGDRRVAPTGPKPNSIGAIIAGFKSASTKKINQLHKTPGRKIWQRNFWEHIIRNKDEYNRIRSYIIKNPEVWEKDKLNPGSKNSITEDIATYTTTSWESIT